MLNVGYVSWHSKQGQLRAHTAIQANKMHSLCLQSCGNNKSYSYPTDIKHLPKKTKP